LQIRKFGFRADLAVAAKRVKLLKSVTMLSRQDSKNDCGGCATRDGSESFGGSSHPWQRSRPPESRKTQMDAYVLRFHFSSGKLGLYHAGGDLATGALDVTRKKQG
jgi:hypothetical protein